MMSTLPDVFTDATGPCAGTYVKMRPSKWYASEETSAYGIWGAPVCDPIAFACTSGNLLTNRGLLEANAGSSVFATCPDGAWLTAVVALMHSMYKCVLWQ